MKTDDRPDPSLVSQLLGRYAPIRLEVALDHLAAGDRRALGKLVEAASWIDRVYWKQRSEDGWRLRQQVSGRHDVNDMELERLLDINFGPWDALNDNRPFWGDRPRPPGGGLYPPDLTRADLDRYLEQHPEQRESLLSHTTLVRRQGNRLVATPYEEVYKEDLTQAAEALVQASKLATHAGFRTFLRSRARGLITGLRDSERLWIDVSDSPIDIAIGPYEVYDDKLIGLKTSYEATVVVRHPMTERLMQLESVASELEQRLPGSVALSNTRRKFVTGVYDVVYTSGLANMGSKAIAATLPNDEWIRANVGARVLLFRNIILAKFEPILQPLGERLFSPDQARLVGEDAFLANTLFHEMAHALSAGVVQHEDNTIGITTNEALQELYSTIEECRADLLGAVFVELLTRHGLFPPEMRASSAVTFVADGMRALRFGAGDDHSRGAAIILSHLLRTRAICLSLDDRLFVDIEGVHRGISELAETVQAVASRGDYEAARDLIDDLCAVPVELERLLPRFTDLPVDLRFVFDDSRRLR